ncbi:MAG: glycogen debranching protein GlgX [Alphaproteobacteria bacterium]|nr:glycogen debranching protein GlgX [Alphaproteobacteria bacterium]
MTRSPIDTIQNGRADKLGATDDGHGVNFAVFSRHAEKIDICLYSDDGLTETARFTLPARTGDVHHGYIPGLKAGQVYGLRAHGPDDPSNGHRFNPQKLLLDPHAEELVGTVKWDDAMADPAQDSAASMVKARVPVPLPPPATPRPHVPKNKTVIMEMHPKGISMLDDKVPPDLRGTYAGIAAPATIAHLKDMGVTTVELLPVAAKLADERLEKLGLANYWGYDTLAGFAPEPSYARDPQNARREFRDMVEALHTEGIEVVLDVVFNHTAEGPVDAPALSLRGIDNASYYRLQPADKSKYIDETGCGNTLDLSDSAVRRMVLDCLRHWVETYGIDGFRFDLAPVLGRDPYAFDTQAAFFREVAADPVLSKIKLIAEPWDIGPGGYQLGNFPKGWQEWNDKFRDDVRKFWRGDDGMAPALATRLAGSAPQFDLGGRKPQDSINMITCHDGFPLHDVVSYNTKHNEQNGEQNRDGNNTNHSHNHGHEGASQDPAIRAAREKTKRNMLSTLFLAQGTPMILAGDEHGNSQHGNNNAYCQDNRIGWVEKDAIDADGRTLQDFTKKLSALRAAHPALTAEKFLHGTAGSDRRKDMAWLGANGKEMRDDAWQGAETVTMLLDEDKIKNPNGTDAGRRLMAVFNRSAAPVDMPLPTSKMAGAWQRALDTDAPQSQPAETYQDKETVRIAPHSVAVFVRKP